MYISQYDYSERQHVHMRSKIRTEVGSTHKIARPGKYLDANSGKTGSQVAVVQIERPKQTLPSQIQKWVSTITKSLRAIRHASLQSLLSWHITIFKRTAYPSFQKNKEDFIERIHVYDMIPNWRFKVVKKLNDTKQLF